MIGVALGSFIGMLLAGVLHELFPDRDLLYQQAGIVALGAFLGLLLDGRSPTGGKKQ